MPNSNIVEIDTLIIGTGFAGIGMAVRLVKENLENFLILEKKDQLGGTWKQNNYPGCKCDVQSHLYSFSFEPNPHWSGTYAESREIHDYLAHCSRKYNIDDRIHFNKECIKAEYDSSLSKWNVFTQDGSMYLCRHLILGLGPLHKPNIPLITDIDKFKGEAWHSDQWNHEYSFKGKKVVSIGTGASAIQYLPQIAQEVDELTIVQRSAAWVMPRSERKYSSLEKKLFSIAPFLTKPARCFFYWANELRLIPIHFPKLASLISGAAKNFIKKSVSKSELHDKLTPDYEVGCKRILVSNDYYPMFNRDNVSLVSGEVGQFTESGVITSDGQYHEADAVIYGTGYLIDPRKYMDNFEVFGLEGQTLIGRWKENLASYYGVTVPGFPNLFQLSGPNSGLSHNSVIFMIESQANYISSAIKKMKRNGIVSISVKDEPFEIYNQAIQANYQGSVWSSPCSSYYKDQDGKNIVLWPNSTWTFRKLTREIDLNDYHCKEV